jgi:hypothetical protein
MALLVELEQSFSRCSLPDPDAKLTECYGSHDHRHSNTKILSVENCSLEVIR